MMNVIHDFGGSAHPGHLEAATCPVEDIPASGLFYAVVCATLISRPEAGALKALLRQLAGDRVYRTIHEECS
jgi:hypothetical protein